ncbi:hypothetical protein [Flavobacterium hibisci]|nr:hypothetical protein [Flavobacterium hibisci]MBZ4044144.1 hypothetical protein [Flavobacterium hibisci]
MTKRFLEVEEIQDLAGEEQTTYFFADEEETKEEEKNQPENDRKGGKTDA